MVFSEPDLEFRNGQKAKDPRDGLGLFGPFDADLASCPQLNYVVLGTTSGLDSFNQWATHMNGPVIDAPNDGRVIPNFISQALKNIPMMLSCCTRHASLILINVLMMWSRSI